MISTLFTYCKKGLAWHLTHNIYYIIIIIIIVIIIIIIIIIIILLLPGLSMAFDT